MRMPHRSDPQDPDADWAGELYRPTPAAPMGPAEVYVDEDKTDRIPFGFQRPARPSSKRPPSRQARANRTRRTIR